MTQFAEKEIVLVYLGNVGSGIVGHEQAMTRPCIIVKNFDILGLVTVVPLTSSKPKSDPYFSIVKLNQGTGRLRSDSFVLCHQIRTISTDRINDSLGILPEKEFYKIQSVLIDILEL